MTSANEMFKCSTGTTAFSYATMQSRERLRYRAGQGVVGRFTALWSTPAASSIVVAGYGSGESGYYFGYNGTSFGILHSTGGVRRIMSFEITTASTTTDDIQIELPSATGVRAYTVTNITSGTTTNTANEIAANTFAGWSVEARGDTVIFLRGAVGVLTGTPTIAQAGAGTPAAATITTVNAGVASTDTWIPQASWNGDVCDGTGATGFNLDVTKGNVFQINVAWLGFGAVTFKIMIPNTDGNNTNWATVDTSCKPARFPIHDGGVLCRIDNGCIAASRFFCWFCRGRYTPDRTKISIQQFAKQLCHNWRVVSAVFCPQRQSTRPHRDDCAGKPERRQYPIVGRGA